jgi:hypothetical protein
MNDRQLKRANCFTKFKILAILTILLLTGTRRMALGRLRRMDVHFDRTGWDGVPRTALAVRPAKGKPWHDVYFKPLPHAAGEILRAWLLYVEIRAARPVRPTDPLFPGTTVRPDRFPNLHGLTLLFGGHWFGESAKHHHRAHFPRRVEDVLRLDEGPPYTRSQTHGYTPHNFRHACDQLVEHGAPAYLARIGEHRISGSIIVKALCNHNMAEDPYSYKDFSSPHGLEKLCAMGSEIAWSVLMTDEGARMVLDRGALTAAFRKRRALERELDDVRERLDLRRSQLAELASQPHESMTAADWTRAQLLRASIDAASDERADLQDALRDLEREIHALQYDPDRRVALADVLPDEAGVVDVDALQMEIDGTRFAAGRRVRRKREWLTPREFAEVAGVSESEVKRWMAGIFSSRHRGPLPWHPESPPVEWISRRRRRIHVSGINPQFLGVAERRDRLEAALSSVPDDSYLLAQTVS